MCMTWSTNTTSSPSKVDYFLFRTLQSFAGIAGAIIFFILIFLIIESFPAIREVGFLAFFIDPSWHPTEGLYNLTPMLLGTLMAAIGAVVLATPLGILLALFCQYYAPPTVATIYQKCIEVLAGIPSVVYGLWGLVVLVPFIAKIHPPGPSLLAGIIVLTIMILPTVTLVSQAAIHQVPLGFIHSATALGLKRWSIIWHIVLPTAWSGILTAVILQTGRAIGETMAIVMVCGNVIQIPTSAFDPIRTLTANIALEMAYAGGSHRASLFLTGLILLLMVISLMIIAQRFRTQHAYG